MSSPPSDQPTLVGTESQDYDDTYYRTYGDEPYEWASPHWRTFFTMVAERIRAVTNPSSVMDVGCAGFIVPNSLPPHASRPARRDS